MAATLTGAGELLYASFPIDKVETDADGDLIVFGKASDGSVDSDQQVVAPSWMRDAAQTWKDTGANLRVQHNAQRDPAGVGLEVETDASGATWVKGLVVEPIAKKLVAKGALRAYSVGIAHPTIERDPTGKARGGIITGGELVEISLVDRPANKRCGIQLVKAADDGTPEYVGKVFGADDEIAKALNGDVTEKSASAADMSGFQIPADLDITFTPNDMARLMQAKVVEKHYAGLAAQATAEADTEKRDVSTAERRSLASEGNALPDGSYPINSTGDLHNAAHLARTGHGNAEAAKKLIARRARELGVANPLADDGDSASKGTVTETAAKNASDEAVQPVMAAEDAVAKEADPDLTKSCSACSGGDCDGDGCSCGKCTGSKCACCATQKAAEPEAKDKPVKKAKKKKKLPPWLNKPSDDEGSDDDKGSSGDSGACKSVTDHLWTGVEGTSDVVCSKCHTTPAEAAGLSGTHDMTAAPVPELLESPPMASTKGSPTPASASGATGESMTPVPAHREPDGALNDPMEADMKASDGDHEAPTRLEAGMMKSSPEVAAILRFKRAGMDIELGRLHDLTCPAYHPEDVAKCHPFSDLSRIDVDAFQREAVKAACGPDLERSKSLTMAWQAAHVLRGANPAELNDFRLAAHKAFRDANPGPNSAPTPGSISPQRYNRPLISDGHESPSSAHDGPNSSPQVATNAPNAHSFDRPPLSAGHQSPSPSFMKASFEYPQQQGAPTQLNYAVMEKERARHALMQMHEHLSRQFPEVCPMDLDAPPVQPESRGVPPTAGIGKDAEPTLAKRLAEGIHNGEISLDDARTALGLAPSGLPEASVPVAAVLKAPAEGDLVDATVYKGFKKMRKKLGKRVLAGEMTVDEARAKMGRQFAQKGGSDEGTVAATYVTADPGMTPTAIKELQDSLNRLAGDPAHHLKVIVLPPGTRTPEPAQKSAVPREVTVAAPPAAAIQPVRLATDPEVIKSAVAEALSPLAAELTSTKALLAEQQEAFTTKLAEQQRVIDAIADQPDPSTAAFSGLAFNPLRNKAAGPAGVPSQAEIAERTQSMMMRTLQDKYNASSDPAEREAYYGTLAKMRGYSGQ